MTKAGGGSPGSAQLRRTLSLLRAIAISIALMAPGMAANTVDHPQAQLTGRQESAVTE